MWKKGGQWYAGALLFYWGWTATIILADYVGTTRCAYEWESTERVLAIPLFAGHAAAACLLGIGLLRAVPFVKNGFSAGLLVVGTFCFALVNFVAYGLVAISYHISMGRSL